MKRYWDLSEKERSELSSDEIEQFCAVELMEKGAIDPGELELVPVPEMPAPDVLAYTVQERYGTPDLCYETAEAAEAALGGSRLIKREYIGGETVYVMSDKQPAIERVSLYSPEKLKECRDAIEAASRAKQKNETAQKEYAAARKAVSEAVAEIRSDREECCEKALKFQRIIRTFEQYTATAEGDTNIARKFLAKAYNAEDIFAAFEWYPQPEVEAAVAASV